MTESDLGAIRPTIVLVGGPMTVDDGSRLDSRQPIEGDPRSQTTRKSLATSWLWWETTSSLVLPLLESAGPDAFALVFGPRSIVDLRSNGAIKRTSFRSFLRGGVRQISLIRTSMDDRLPDGYDEVTTLRAWNGQSVGIVGIKQGDGSHRWRLLDGNEYYLSYAADIIRPTIVVDAGDSVIGGETVGWPSRGTLESFESGRMFRNDGILVLPHTSCTETFVAAYVRWVQAGRSNAPTGEGPWGGSTWDPTSSPESVRYAYPVPVEADFHVTGLVQDGEWRDPSDLEAARSLLQARFDLKLGIWDLVHNPLLRRTLLESKPVSPPPAESAGVPHGAVERATAALVAKRDRLAQAEAALKTLTLPLKPLEAVGWTRLDAGQSQLPLTEPLRTWPSEEEPTPLAWLLLTVTKQRTEVAVGIAMYNDLDLRGYVSTRRDQLESIAGASLADPERSSATLWSAAGGWATELDWRARALELAEKTPAWAALFEEMATECRRIQAERFAGVTRPL